MNSNSSAHLDKPNAEPANADGLSVAVIGPDNLLRSAAARALVACHKGEVREFSSYPPCLGDLPQLLDQHHDIVMIELDSNPDYALDLVEGICASGMSTVMVYSKDSDPDLTDPDLLMRCMKAGAREFLSMPFGDKSMNEALERASARRPTVRPEKKSSGGRLLVFCGAKGGAGVTAIACNYAIALSMESSESTLLIDLDLPMGDAALNLGIVADYSTIDALQNASRLDSSFLSKLIVKHSSGISVLASPGNVSAYQPSNESIDRLLTVARRDFKNVIVDVGSRLDSPASMAPFSDATMFYLVTQTGIPELRNANRLISQYFNSDNARLEIVLNRFESRGTRISEENVKKALTRSAKWKIPNDYSSIRKMQDNATPVALTDSFIGRQIGQMARFVCGLPEIPEKKKSGGFSFKGLGLGISSKTAPVEDSPDELKLQMVTGQSSTPKPLLIDDSLETPSVASHLGIAPAASEENVAALEDVAAPESVRSFDAVAASALPLSSFGVVERTARAIEEDTFEFDATVPVTVDWPAPAPITCGTALGDAQFNATASVEGAFLYTPSKGYVLPAGLHTIWTTFTPSGRGGEAYRKHAHVALEVSKAIPVISWQAPAKIAYGTALGVEQLNAQTSVPGWFTYTPAKGTVLVAGTHTVSVHFTPEDRETQSEAAAQVELAVAKSVPRLSWMPQAPIAYGTPLGKAQLNATASIPGTFVYSPAEGDVLPAGRHTLSVSFTPSDSANYTSAQGEVVIPVSKVKPAVTWRTPKNMAYGTALSAQELNATASVPGRFEYTPGAGAVLSAGRHTPVAVFTPSDAANYMAVQIASPIDVVPAKPVIHWPLPDAISYGSQLTEVELNATASVPGSFTYTPRAGAVLNEGTQMLSVVFTPTDDTNYVPVEASVPLTVTAAAPITISWLAPEAITYGDRLSERQLNATASVPGTMNYHPAAGAILSSGAHKLSVTFSPASGYGRPHQVSVDIEVEKAKPILAWAAPTAIPYGTALGAQQLNANSSVPGSYIYSPAAGEVLSAGTQPLWVQFLPADTANYTEADALTSVNVTRALPAITWPVPSPISYGTPISARQLNAVASVPGTFTYAPFEGTVLTVGTHMISVSFVPSDRKNYATVEASVPIAVLLTNIELMPLDAQETEEEEGFEAEPEAYLDHGRDAYQRETTTAIGMTAGSADAIHRVNDPSSEDHLLRGRGLSEGIHLASPARDRESASAWMPEACDENEEDRRPASGNGLYLYQAND